MNTVVIVDHEAGELTPGTLRAISIARGLASPFAAFCPTTCPPSLHDELDRLGIPQVRSSGVFAPPTDSVRTSKLIEQACETLGEPHLILAAPSIGLRDAVGRLAVRRGTPVLSGVTSISALPSGELHVHASHEGGGTIVESIVFGPAICLVDPSPHAIEPYPSPGCAQTFFNGTLPKPSVEVIESTEQSRSDAQPLHSAQIVVSGGRGLGSAPALQRLLRWAEQTGYAFGSSRAPVESEWVDYDRLVGQTGTTIAPKLYVAFGISGAPQHMSGVLGAERIVAINTDPRAPIADHADLVLVTDAVELLQQLEEASSA